MSHIGHPQSSFLHHHSDSFLSLNHFPYHFRGAKASSQPQSEGLTEQANHVDVCATRLWVRFDLSFGSKQRSARTARFGSPASANMVQAIAIGGCGVHNAASFPFIISRRALQSQKCVKISTSCAVHPGPCLSESLLLLARRQNQNTGR